MCKKSTGINELDLLVGSVEELRALLWPLFRREKQEVLAELYKVRPGLVRKLGAVLYLNIW